MKYLSIICAFQAIAICLFPLASTSKRSKQLLLLSDQPRYYPSTETQYPTIARVVEEQLPVGPFFGYFPNLMSRCSLCSLCPSSQSGPVSPVTCPPSPVCPTTPETTTPTTTTPTTTTPATPTPTPTTCATCPTCKICPTPPPPETITTCGSGLKSVASVASTGTVLVDIPSAGVDYTCLFAFTAYPPNSKVTVKCNSVSSQTRFWISPISSSKTLGTVGTSYTSTGNFMIMTANNLLNNAAGIKLDCTWTGVP